MKHFFPVLVCLFFSSCNSYIWKAFIYNDPGLKDYRFMPWREVKNGEPQPLPLHTKYNQIELPDTLKRHLKKTQTKALLIFKNDSLIYEWYAKGFSDSSYSNPFSASKSIIGILTGIALYEGKIKSLDEPVCHYYKPWQEGKRNQITFRHLLSMTSGVDYYDQFLNPFGKLAKLYYGNNLPELVNSIHSQKTPGSEWRYKNCDPQILSLALSNAVGCSISEYASEKLWKPLGATYPARWLVDSKHQNAVEKTYCCFNTNARDIARFGMLYEHFGKWKDKIILDSQYVKQSITPVQLPNAQGKYENNYGYLWWLRNTDNLNEFSMEGMKGQYVIVVPSERLIIVRFGNKEWYKTAHRFRFPEFRRHLVRSIVGLFRELGL
ncbi:MAG: serine hydrolase [Chitinophagales bacterium]|nr:beta-lactamase family protein [Chitinophagales bacterium]MDW8274611.1 serine hydrolase [Chitinophagales bacterium]